MPGSPLVLAALVGLVLAREDKESASFRPTGPFTAQVPLLKKDCHGAFACWLAILRFTRLQFTFFASATPCEEPLSQTSHFAHFPLPFIIRLIFVTPDKLPDGFFCDVRSGDCANKYVFCDVTCGRSL
jgi:hypothetical protein